MKGSRTKGCRIHSPSGGQGVRREAESEGHAEKYRAVVEGATQ